MRIDIRIHADSTSEFKQALLNVAATIPDDMFAQPTRGFTIKCEPEYSPAQLGVQTLSGIKAMPAAVVEAPEAQGDTAETPRRTRRTKAQIEADNAAENATAQAANGTGKDPEDTVPESATATMSPAEYKLAALDILREAYGKEGGPAGVKTIQKDFDVAKFIEVPDGRGPELHARAVALRESLEL